MNLFKKGRAFLPNRIPWKWWLFVFAILGSGYLVSQFGSIGQSRAAGTFTVCPTCDFTSLRAALEDPQAEDATIILTDDYVFDASEELIGVMPTGTTIECESNAPKFGDSAEPAIWITLASNNTFQDCTFENVNFETSFQDNITFRNNTFSADAPMQIVLTVVDGFHIEYNNGLQKIQIQTAFNGTINNNNFECRHGNNCLSLTPAGGDPGDYFDPTLVPSNIDIYQNNFINYNVSSGGDWVIFNAGLDIQFTDNHIQSYVIIDDTYIVMMTLEKGDFNLERNRFIFPSKDSPASQSTWGLNLRTSDVDLYVNAQHNDFIISGGGGVGSACMGLYQPSPTTPNDVYLDFDYNLCANISGNPATGFSLSRDPSFLNLHLTDTYNGFSKINNLVDDPHSEVFFNGNSVVGDVLFKTENADSSDDLEYAPMSRFLDVDGTIDIGIYSDTRINEYTIDANCVVDYVLCHSKVSSAIAGALSSGDFVHVKDGTYLPIVIDRNLNGVNIVGEGNNVVFDATGLNSNGITFEANLDNSNISNITIQNASAAGESYTFEATNAVYEYLGTDYNDSPLLGAPPNGHVVIYGSSCDSQLVWEDNSPIALDSATQNFNLGLATLMGSVKLSVFIANNLASNGSAMADFLTNECGIPAVVDVFVSDAFTVNDKIFTYNTSAVSAAGITLLPVSTNPPRIDTINNSASGFVGLSLLFGSNNNFTNINLPGNNIGLYLDADFFDNEFTGLHLSSSDISIISESSGVNKFYNTALQVNTVSQSNGGSLEIYQAFRGRVMHGANPISGAEVVIKNVGGTELSTLVTDNDGFTSFLPATLVTVISSGGPYTPTAGGINPLSFTTNVSDYNPFSLNHSVAQPFETVLLALTKPSEPTPPIDEEDDEDNDNPAQNGGNNQNPSTPSDNNGSSTNDGDNEEESKEQDDEDKDNGPTVVPVNPGEPSENGEGQKRQGAQFEIWWLFLLLLLFFLILFKRRKKEEDEEELRLKNLKPKTSRKSKTVRKSKK